MQAELVDYTQYVKADNVTLLDEVLGFRIVGHVNSTDLGGIRAHVHILIRIAEGDYRVKAVQPATAREVLLYTLLQEAWSEKEKSKEDPKDGK